MPTLYDTLVEVMMSKSGGQGLAPQKTHEEKVQDWMRYGQTNPPIAADPAWEEAQTRLRASSPIARLTDAIAGISKQRIQPDKLEQAVADAALMGPLALTGVIKRYTGRQLDKTLMRMYKDWTKGFIPTSQGNPVATWDQFLETILGNVYHGGRLAKEQGAIKQAPAVTRSMIDLAMLPMNDYVFKATSSKRLGAALQAAERFGFRRPATGEASERTVQQLAPEVRDRLTEYLNKIRKPDDAFNRALARHVAEGGATNPHARALTPEQAEFLKKQTTKK